MKTSIHLAAFLWLIVLPVRAGLAPKPSGEIIVLPKFVITGDAPVYGLSWRCKWPTQKSKIVRAWFDNIPASGVMAKAGVRKDDLLLQLDGIVLTEMTGEWMSARLKQPWVATPVHQIVFERARQKYSVTIEAKSTPEPAPGPAPGQ